MISLLHSIPFVLLRSLLFISLKFSCFIHFLLCALLFRGYFSLLSFQSVCSTEMQEESEQVEERCECCCVCCSFSQSTIAEHLPVQRHIERIAHSQRELLLLQNTHFSTNWKDSRVLRFEWIHCALLRTAFIPILICSIYRFPTVSKWHFYQFQSILNHNFPAPFPDKFEYIFKNRYELRCNRIQSF